MSRVVLLLLLALAGCADADALCTTSACAAAPCTAGCSYERRSSGCSAEAPVTVSKSVVLACPDVCASLDQPDGFGSTTGGSCFGTVPGCVVAAWCPYDSHCEHYSSGFGQNQAVICASSEQCVQSYTEGGEDAALPACVDMSSTVDLTVELDLAERGDGGASD